MVPLGYAGFLAILANNQAEPGLFTQWAVSHFLHFQRLMALENGGTSLCRGTP
jgi:hypothetical protein